MSAESTDNIDQGIKRLEWANEDLGGIGGHAADAILGVIPRIRETHPEEALILLNSMRGWFSYEIDDHIAENEREIAEERQDG